MQTRRTLLAGMAATATLSWRASAAPPNRPAPGGDAFDHLYAQLLNEPDVLENTRQSREGMAFEYDLFETKKIGPRFPPSSVKISDAAVRSIVLFEVSSAEVYQRRYRQPVWPQGQSGVTIGVGYDLGYSTTEWLQEDWAAVLCPAQLAQLKTACGAKGGSASQIIHNYSGIKIDWDLAYKQFMTTSLPRFIAETLHVLPNADKLPADCLGALVSLDYNRGASFKLRGSRYTEMRAIHLHMTNKNYVAIPAQFRSMTRLWENDPNAAGVVTRRKLEAALFERGLKQL